MTGVRVTLCTASVVDGASYRNVGDELLTVVFADALRDADATVAATLAGALDRPGRFDPSRPGQLWRAVRDADVVVLGGGTLLQADRPSTLGLVPTGMARYVAAVAACARAARVPLVVAGVGAESLTDRGARAAARFVAGTADAVLVRDARSARYLADTCGVAASVAADVVFAGPIPGGGRPADRPGGPVVCPTGASTDADLDALAAWAATRAGGAVVDVVITHRSPADVQRRDDLAARIRRAGTRARTGTVDSPDALLALVAAAPAVATGRLHLAYAAAMSGCEVAVSGTVPKVTTFAADAGIPDVRPDGTAAVALEWCRGEHVRARRIVDVVTDVARRARR